VLSDLSSTDLSCDAEIMLGLLVMVSKPEKVSDDEYDKNADR